MISSLALLLLCPLCAERPLSSSAALAVLALLAVPFVVAALVWRAVRKADS